MAEQACRKEAKICEKEAVDPKWYREWGKKQCRESVQNEQKYAKRGPLPPMGTPFEMKMDKNAGEARGVLVKGL